EIADIFVVSKMDKPGADQTVAELAMLLSLDSNRRKAAWRIPIMKVAALKGQGIPQLIDAIQQHREYLTESGMMEHRAQRQVRSELQVLIMQAVANSLKSHISEEEWNTLIADITSRQRDPYSVAQELEARIGLDH
ncbi:MAG TPA: methylmalonyl Co-A mutase-associated GTPase MeaB, partial [Ktedonobacteraceae bacterium]|nr:methylmalonyl Co-A mutase-associated GTPase MeaB [Ktedonobacteraceae bacterium]